MTSAMTVLSYNESAVFKLVFYAGTQLHGATTSVRESNVPDFPSADSSTLAQIMASYWISLAVTHNPNPHRAEGARAWPSYMGGANGAVANGEGVGYDVL